MKLEEIIDKYNKQDFKNIGYEDIVMDLNSVATEEQKSGAASAPCFHKMRLAMPR